MTEFNIADHAPHICYHTGFLASFLVIIGILPTAEIALILAYPVIFLIAKLYIIRVAVMEIATGYKILAFYLIETVASFLLGFLLAPSEIPSYYYLNVWLCHHFGWLGVLVWQAYCIITQYRERDLSYSFTARPTDWYPPLEFNEDQMNIMRMQIQAAANAEFAVDEEENQMTVSEFDRALSDLIAERNFYIDEIGTSLEQRIRVSALFLPCHDCPFFKILATPSNSQGIFLLKEKYPACMFWGGLPAPLVLETLIHIHQQATCFILERQKTHNDWVKHYPDLMEVLKCKDLWL
jgi:hypothetical protein